MQLKKNNKSNHIKAFFSLNKTELFENLNKDCFLKDLKDLIGFNKKIIEFSTGFGEHSIYFAYATNNQVTHINDDPKKLQLLKEFCAKNNISNLNFKKGKTLNGISKKKNIDVFFCKNTLEKSLNPIDEIKNITSVCKKNSLLVISVKHCYRVMFSNFKIKLCNIFSREKKHLEIAFSIKKLSNLLEANNINVLGTIPDANFDGFYIGLENMKGFKSSYFRAFFSQIRALLFEDKNFYFIGKLN